MNFETIHPATGEFQRAYDLTESSEIEALLDRATQAQAEWRERPARHRAQILRPVAERLRKDADEFAHQMTLEMGKPLREARAEVEKCAWVCEFYAEHGPGFLEDEPVSTEARQSYVAYRPLGLILAIMPWNFPFWQVFRFLAPALVAGNGALLKHAPNVPGCAEAIEQLFQNTGRLPEGLFRNLRVPVDAVADLLADPRIHAATLTGSTRAGRAVAEGAGRNLKKVVLELGGSDPYLILEDADLDRAVDLCLTSRLLNSGQSCIAAKRFLVVDSVREEFEQRFVEGMAQRKMGDPFDETTQVGPMARQDLRDALHRQVEASVAAGARCLLGGQIPEGPGFFYPPTVLTDVAPGMPAYDEELFGPVASVIPVADEEEAVRIANDTVYGLGAAVFTRDLERGQRLAERLEAGCCFVNDFVKSDPRLPFGGIKASGYGRELSHHGLLEFVNAKTVWIQG